MIIITCTPIEECCTRGGYKGQGQLIISQLSNYHHDVQYHDPVIQVHYKRNHFRVFIRICISPISHCVPSSNINVTATVSDMQITILMQRRYHDWDLITLWLKSSFQKTRTCQSYKVNAVAADNLAMPGTGTSVAMALTYRLTSNIRRTKSQNLYSSRLV